VLANEFHPPLPVHDYGHALQSALSWLGDRYLLAAPITARGYDRQMDLSFAVKRHVARGFRDELTHRSHALARRSLAADSAGHGRSSF
jgi:hypothetical protein